ncbi:DUF5655 domain-containing protein [Hydromonas duriensis]|uniref:Putative transport protein n=1 Tax=Hydromonas duriensis TaxID=1527608 RepID=A0A4R6Y9Q1_9BURK|nr:DUF5655 domain-containing protein [Hydromonas duriensis]TDR32194.1 putative transport protein [Hydromonas duriensis]
MSDIRLFELNNKVASELQGEALDLEKPLQNLIEANLEPLLGVRFLSTEYSTGRVHGGRIDTLGLDENHCPVIIEYKRSVGENVINQGLFYLDWLMDHQAEFELLVLKLLGDKASTLIDWDAPRLICIAGDFTKFDAHAVQQIDRNVDLVRYRLFGQGLLLLEQVNASVSGAKARADKSRVSSKKRDKNTSTTKLSSKKSTDKSYVESVADASSDMCVLLSTVEDYIQSLGDDVVRKELKLYVAFKRLRNFASIVVQKNRLLMYLNVNPDTLALPMNARDVRKFGHWGTGDLELSIGNHEDFEMSKSLILSAYEGRHR